MHEKLSLSSPIEVITMTDKNENKEQGKTQHETPYSKPTKPQNIRMTTGPPL